MLSHLSIKNYATVESLEIEFQPGMSVITGETGAGKSIILGALGFTLGDRADKTIVRPGASLLISWLNSRSAASSLRNPGSPTTI